ncbi:hypothetical protein AGABI2DRAFT_120588 [Agaricus bisporus var. bisporus H97]|uniref:hypothetical protein n=1 Tax=Agaricus bisporus var. bisporus (strain H97 / ATCC MYA-4626 / FGSC 10389) TaxID=936046 RepID=UPI00029F5C08|nr:hypothetical protein AGABI2DRAFT_120588 [Agaricus bisporus var. bisporus H97]EKV44460.1 hypothetical protein AGABI2DRAFT_120588 [Agaricus bisporus var. bisporus H97]
MSMYDTIGNLDVWTEIMEYFKISTTHDSDSEVKQKQNALLQIALVSPSLTAPALDLLWHTMTSLEPVTKVLNSEAEVVSFQDDQGGHWVLRQPLTSEKIQVRACNYLSRIRHLRIKVGSLKELRVWSILAVALGINPLLSKIESLYLDLSKAADISTWLYPIATLLSPALRSISYHAASSAHAAGIITLHSISRSRSLALTCIEYHGHPFAELLQQCLLFDQLDILTLNFGNQAIERYTQAPAVIADIFDALGSLKDLRIDLRVFPLRNQDSPSKPSPVAPLLRSLCITGHAGDLLEFLLDGIKSPTLTSLDISVVNADGLIWKTLCDRATANFPQMHSFSLDATSSSGSIPQLLMQDISSLTSREIMTSFRINGVPHCINDINIPGLVRSWPRLRSFMILNDYGMFFCAAVLAELSHLSRLSEVALPLNLVGLQDQLPVLAPVADCPLKEITITKFGDAPSSLDGKIDLARSMLSLFPLIDRIYGSEESQRGYLTEVEKLLSAFHSTIAMQARRRALRIGQKKPVSKGRAVKRGDYEVL